MNAMEPLCTIGHSDHSTDRFIEMLEQNGVAAVCDVLSSPYSKYVPQFNREVLKDDLKHHGFVYVYLGDQLGPRSDHLSDYEDGKVQYDRLARRESFQKGLERVKKGLERYCIALMCSEKDPIECHRMILVCRHLRHNSFEIRHILADGQSEANAETEKRLMRAVKIQQMTLFDDPENLVEQAYDRQGQKIAHRVKDLMEKEVLNGGYHDLHHWFYAEVGG
jgi:uncharacterized protein (DUF488 family)